MKMMFMRWYYCLTLQQYTAHTPVTIKKASIEAMMIIASASIYWID
jgi:hypothetical protein